MRRQELYLMGQLADLPIGGLGIPVLKEVLDYSESASLKKGDRTFTFKLPCTGRVKRILGERHDPQITRKWNDTRECTARYYVDGLLIISGQFSIVESTGSEITLRIIGDNIAWVGQFSQRKLADIESLGSIGFIGSESQDVTVEPVDAVTQPDVWALGESTEIQFPLVARGNFPTNSPSSGESAYRLDQTEWWTFPPAVFVAPIIRAMFADAGLKIIGSWINNPFLAPELLPYVGQMQVPWNWGFLSRALAETSTPYTYQQASNGIGDNYNWLQFTYGVSSCAGYNLLATVEAHDYSRSYDITVPEQNYLCPVAGRYEFTVEVSFSATEKFFTTASMGGPVAPNFDRYAIAIVRIPTDSSELDALRLDLSTYISDGSQATVNDFNILAFLDFGQTIPYVDSPATGSTPGYTSSFSQVWVGPPLGVASHLDGSGDVSLHVVNVPLAQGDRVEFWLLHLGAVAGTPDLLASTTSDVSAYSVAVREISLPERMEATAILPDMTQLDLFQTMIRKFNLHWQVENGLIRIESHDDFYKPVQSAVVVDSPLTTSENKPVPFAKTTNFEWALDSADILLQRHGQGRYGKTSTASSIHFDRDSETVSLAPFSATIDRKFIARNNFTLSNDVLIAPCMATEATLGVQSEIEWEYGFAPRLLRWAGMQPGRFVYAGVSKTEYPAARFAFSEADGKGLLWGDSDGTAILHDRGSMVNYLPSLGMFMYWARLFAHRQKSELVTVLVNISLKDFAQLDISKPVIADGIGYTIYSLGSGFDPSKDSLIEMGLMRL